MARLKTSHARTIHDVEPKKVKKSGDNKRTSRACDRCRFKKSKCDGLQPCMNCRLNERTCIFSARRRRDARNWYCGMQEVVDEALQRLYKACKQADCFPGTLPVELDGRVTTEDILGGLGLATEPAPFQESGSYPTPPSPHPSTATTVPTTTSNVTDDGSAHQRDSPASLQRHDSANKYQHRASLHRPNSTTTIRTQASQVQVASAIPLSMNEQFDHVLSAHPWIQGDLPMNPLASSSMSDGIFFQDDQHKAQHSTSVHGAEFDAAYMQYLMSQRNPFSLGDDATTLPVWTQCDTEVAGVPL